MDKYERVRTPRPEINTAPNEIRVMAGGKCSEYVKQALALVEDGGAGAGSVVLSGLGKAINKAVIVAEVLKRKVPGLHQTNALSSTPITDVWEPKEEGLDRIETTRQVSVLTVTLARGAPADTAAPGYQAPPPGGESPLANEEELLGEGDDGEPRRRGGGRGRGRSRGRGRGGGTLRGGRTGDPVADAAEGAGEEGGPKRRARRPRGGRNRRGGGAGGGDGAPEGAGDGGAAGGGDAAPEA